MYRHVCTYTHTHVITHRYHRPIPHCLQWYSDNSSAEEKQLFTDEINVMKTVSVDNNPHVLKMLGCVTATNPMMLVLQFVPQGNLKNYLRAMKTVDNVRNVIVSKFLSRCLLCRVPALWWYYVEYGLPCCSVCCCNPLLVDYYVATSPSKY